MVKISEPTDVLAGLSSFLKKKKFPFFQRSVAAARDDSRIFQKMKKISLNLLQKIPKFQFHSLHSRRVGLVGVRPLKKPPDRCSYLLKLHLICLQPGVVQSKNGKHFSEANEKRKKITVFFLKKLTPKKKCHAHVSKKVVFLYLFKELSLITFNPIRFSHEKNCNYS